MQKNLINRQETAKGGQNTSLTRHNNNLCQSKLLLQRSWVGWFNAVAFLVIVLFFASTYVGTTATLYVNVNSQNPVSPYTSWGTAANAIQDAIDVAQSGDTVFVTNGTYNSGGKAVYGTMTNRVAIYKPITVQSVNGPAVTFIVGAKSPNGTNGDGAIRCVYVCTNGFLSGFTLTNGHTQTSGDYYNKGQSGGGVLCETDGLVSNCVLTGNSANYYGGGSYQGTLYNCTLTGNSAYEGGGSYQGTLYNCTLTGNSASDSGGGSYYGTLYNCTLTGNSVNYYGGGSYKTTLYNCIVYYNTAPNGSNYYYSTFYYSCTTPLPDSEGNISDEPLFVDLSNGNLRLQSNSPCINAGINLYAVYHYAHIDVDLDGRPRIINGIVDMGSYEFQTSVPGEFIGWLQKHGLPTDGSADYIDSDGDGLNNWREFQLGKNLLIKDNPGFFSLIERLPNNKTCLKFIGEPGKQYKIETSSNLINWVEFMSVSITNADSSTSIDETNTTPFRFYRSSLLSQ